MKPLLTSLITALVLSFALPSEAKPTVRDLITHLRSGPNNRTRAQAALELARAGEVDQARRPLEQALDDKSAAVRTAAAVGLRKLGDARAIEALKRHRRDRSPTVRSQISSTLTVLENKKAVSEATPEEKPTVLVKLGRMSAVKNRKKNWTTDRLEEMRNTTRQKLGALPGVVVLTESDDAVQESKRRGVPAVLITAAVKNADETPEGSSVTYSAKIEFVVHTVPGEAIASLIARSASASADAAEARDQDRVASLQSEILAAAVDSALKRAPDAFRAAMK